MPGFREHPLDRPLGAMVQAMNDADEQLGKMAEGMGDFDSKALSPEEDELIFHNPSLRYLGQVEPTTGLPYTNAQAAQKLLQDLGPEQYVAYVQDFVRRADRRAGASLKSAGGSPASADAEASQETPAGQRTGESLPVNGLPTAQAGDSLGSGSFGPGGAPGTLGSGTMGSGTMGDSNAP